MRLVTASKWLYTTRTTATGTFLPTSTRDTGSRFHRISIGSLTGRLDHRVGRDRRNHPDAGGPLIEGAPGYVEARFPGTAFRTGIWCLPAARLFPLPAGRCR